MPITVRDVWENQNILNMPPKVCPLCDKEAEGEALLTSDPLPCDCQLDSLGEEMERYPIGGVGKMNAAPKGSVIKPLSSEAAEWLLSLQESLWPPESRKKDEMRIKLKATRTLAYLEFEKLKGIIEEYGLLTSMFSTSMFGGYGMAVYEHAQYPETPPQPLLQVIEDHLPVPHRLVQVEEGSPNKQPGEGRTDAWEAFSKYTHAEHNAAWLKMYKMDPPRPRSHYDY